MRTRPHIHTIFTEDIAGFSLLQALHCISIDEHNRTSMCLLSFHISAFKQGALSNADSHTSLWVALIWLGFPRASTKGSPAC